MVRAGIGASGAGRLVEHAMRTVLAPAFRLAHADTRPRICLIAAGKAAPAMAAAAAEQLGTAVRGGLVVSGVDAPVPDGYELIVGDHPLPNAGSERAGRRALQIASSTGSDDTLLVLLSGGASALMAAPADGVTMADKRAASEILMLAGADIHALNSVRKHLSVVKGGQLAAGAAAQTIGLAVSDVVGNDLSVIASGPTVADGSTYAVALAALRRFGGVAAYPPAVVARLERGAAGLIEETCKAGDVRLGKATTTVIGSRRDAMDGATAEARRLGYATRTIEEPVIGEARDAAAPHLDRVRTLVADRSGPICIVSSGETTVTVHGRGTGGRNQEFALACALESLQASYMLASVGTDGIDGPTDAAGALVDRTTLERSRTLGLPDPRQFLRDNNAYAFFSALGDLIHTGATDTNVGDLQLILVA